MASYISKKDAARKKQGGQGLVLFLFLLLVLVGFGALAVDYSMLALEASNIQKATDSAALAGAAKLVLSKNSGTLTATAASQTAARNDAIFIAAQNGYTLASSDISFPLPYRIRVEASANSPLFLAKIWSAESAQVKRHATAEMTPIQGISGAAPLGITTQDYNTYKSGATFELRLVRNQEADFDPGEVIGLSNQTDSHGKSPSKWEENLAQGIASPVSLGQYLLSINAASQNQGTRLVNGLEERGINSIFPIIVTNPKPVTHGNSEHEILELVYVKLIEVRKTGTGSNLEAYVKFQIQPNRVVSPEMTTVTIGGTPGLDTSGNIFILRLIDDL